MEQKFKIRLIVASELLRAQERHLRAKTLCYPRYLFVVGRDNGAGDSGRELGRSYRVGNERKSGKRHDIFARDTSGTAAGRNKRIGFHLSQHTISTCKRKRPVRGAPAQNRYFRRSFFMTS